LLKLGAQKDARTFRVLAFAAALVWLWVCYAYTAYTVARSDAENLAMLRDSMTNQVKTAVDRLDAEFRAMTDFATAFAAQPAVVALLQKRSTAATPLVTLDPAQKRSTLLQDPAVLELDDYFRRVIDESQYELIFVLDADGVCLAINDGSSPESGIGVSYADRHYFQSALANGTGLEFAVGRTVPSPAFFFARAVEADGRPIGVAVVRKRAATLAPLLATRTRTILVVDDQGVVAASGHPELILKRIKAWSREAAPVDPAVYGQAALEDLDIRTVAVDGELSAISWNGQPFTAVGRKIGGSPYTIWVANPTTPRDDVHWPLFKVGISAAIAGILALLALDRMVAYVVARRSHTAALAAANAALQTANAQLFALATVDPLTGLASRRHFLERARESLAVARRAKQPRTLIVLDLDHFKQINDTYGHPVGDAVLAGAARAWRELTRESDLIGRLGGEEFALLLTDTDEAGALILAERLRAAVAALELPHEGGTIKATASLGVAELKPGEEFEALYARADAALYAAKSGGRNRVVAGSVMA